MQPYHAVGCTHRRLPSSGTSRPVVMKIPVMQKNTAPARKRCGPILAVQAEHVVNLC